MRGVSAPSMSQGVIDTEGAGWSSSIGEYPSGLMFSADGSRLAVSDASGRIWIHDAGSGDSIRDWQAHALGVRSLYWHPDGCKLLSGGEDGCAWLWHGAEFGDSTQLVRGRPWVDHVSFSPCGTRLVIAAGKNLTFADADGSRPVASESHASSITHDAQLARRCANARRRGRR
jgi:WD40 repeat protein